jgi:DHA2 family multidrug resistance protein
MRAALGASVDSISWVLTSFIMAGAIATPMTGWLSDRVGSRNLFIWSTAVFLIASAACGAATSLEAMVVFRIFQGTAAAFLGPMTQTIMFDVSPPSKQAATMSQFGMIVMVAPISGPFLGGFLTEYLNWRWIYYVNLPIGIPALVARWFLLPSRQIERRRLDLAGLAFLGLALGALQLMLDRGQQKDWFQSWEIVIELIVVLSAFWMFLVHTLRQKVPLFDRELFTNPPFLVGCAFKAILGLTNVALSAVLPTMYQVIYHFPVMYSGMLMAPRGFGVIITSQLTTYLLTRMDYRWIIAIGYVIAAGSLWIMTTWSIEMDWHRIALASFVQGLGLGMVFAPLNVVAFATIPAQLRPDGSSLLALFRNVGGSFGISMIVTLLARNQQVSHADIAANVTATSVPGVDLSAIVDQASGMGPAAMEMINNEVTRQAAMIAYLDNFFVLAWVLLAIAPIPFILKRPKEHDIFGQHVAMD